MNEKIKSDGKLNLILQAPFYLSAIFIIINIAIYFIDIPAGLFVSAFIVLYLAALIFLRRFCKDAVINEISHIQGFYDDTKLNIMENTPFPSAILDTDGKVMWMSRDFMFLTGKDEDFHKSVASIFSHLTKEMLQKIDDETSDTAEYGGRTYRIYLKRMNLTDYMGERLHIISKEGYKQIILLTLADKTMQTELEQKYKNEKMSVALLYMDNYEEVIESMEEVKASILQALVDRKIDRFFSGRDIVLKRFEHDKYIIIFKSSMLKKYMEDKFSILTQIKDVKAGNSQGVTLSLGIGTGGEDYKSNYEYAKAAIDLALGRGGDQAVIKSGENTEYFSGSNKQIERQTTRVKARMKAQALHEMISLNDTILIMGHHIGDIDSFGASIGIFRAASSMNKKTHIVLDQVTSSIRPMKALFSPDEGYPSDMFITPDEAVEMATEDTMVMVVDVNRPSYTECPALLEISKKIVVFDHHRHGSDTISNAVLSYIESYASSTCEMVTEVLQYFPTALKLTPAEADCIYSGIIIDTNSFTTKTGVRTFEAAAFLRRSGADVTRVRKMMQNDMNAYKARAQAVRTAETYRDCFALTIFPDEHIESPTVAGAQAANELLNIIGIKASFVFTEYQGVIYVSSRSIDEIDVQAIMSRIGGGGHMNVAGAQIADCTAGEAMTKVKEILDEMIEKGDITL